MRKGLLAQWSRKIVGRGVAAAMLLAVPVGVAAVIGFSDGLGGVARGFDALDGPEPQAVPPSASGRALDRALVSLAGGPMLPPPPAPAARKPSAAIPGAESPGTVPVRRPLDPASIPLRPRARPRARHQWPPASIRAPSGTVGSLVDDVNQSVNGLIGAQP